MEALYGLLLCFSVALASVPKSDHGECWTPRKEDVDWNRLNVAGPWFDVLDVPFATEPIGCWTIVETTPTKNGFDLILDVSKDGAPFGEIFVEHFTRVKTGVYHATSEIGWYDPYRYLGESSDKAQEMATAEELAHADWTALTDYKNYLILVMCDGTEWYAFVKFNKPDITAEELHEIADVLAGNGLEAPTMTIKKKCNGGFW